MCCVYKRIGIFAPPQPPRPTLPMGTNTFLHPDRQAVNVSTAGTPQGIPKIEKIEIKFVF